MKKAGALASALQSSGATVAAGPQPVSEPQPAGDKARKEAKSRADTVPITVHHPKEVRRQLKGMAAELDRTMDDLIAEAFNLLFTHYRKPEIAPRKNR
jgi:hypothetical protein